MRILLLTLIFAALGMGLGLFFGILGAVLYGAVRHTHVDMAMAYRAVAIPFAITFGSCAFLYNAVLSIRRAARHEA
jgi:hypothetical protein